MNRTGRGFGSISTTASNWSSTVPRSRQTLDCSPIDRELDDALGLTEAAGGLFQDSRTGKNGWQGMTGLFRQSFFGRLGGYEDVNDADRLGRDPAMRWIVGDWEEPSGESRIMRPLASHHRYKRLAVARCILLTRSQTQSAIQPPSGNLLPDMTAKFLDLVDVYLGCLARKFKVL